MASLFGSTALLSHPLTGTYHLAASQTPPPSQPQQTPPPSPSLSTSSLEQLKPAPSKVEQQRPATHVETTEWGASTLTRRYGLSAGLACAAFLAVGIVSQEEANKRNVEKEEEVVLQNGIRYYETRVGHGTVPRSGDLVVIDLKGKIQGSNDIFIDTFVNETKPLAMMMGSRPYCKGMCEGLEYVVRSMKPGGRRRVIIPYDLGFGEKGADLGTGFPIPPFATLEYAVEIDEASIAAA